MDAIFHFRCRRWKKMSLFRVDGINSLDVDIIKWIVAEGFEVNIF